jgi:phospholipase C
MVALCAFLVGQVPTLPADAATEPTHTPIKHVVIVIGENRSFDHVFGTYVPRPGQTISNLLSKGIVTAAGVAGPNFPLARQFAVPAQSTYYVAAPAKTPYATLPAPNTGSAPTAQSDTTAPFKTLAEAAAAEHDLAAADLGLLTTGATGLPQGAVDTRVTSAMQLPNGPFPLSGPTLPYDAYTGDTIHQFFQMWQQSDCSVAHASPGNPTGCLSDLYPFVSGNGNAMGFYDTSAGDAPFLKDLADRFVSSDNFHQSVMGGSGPNHLMLGTGDMPFFSDGQGNGATPPAATIANPDPQPGTNNQYILNGFWSRCADATQPGVGPILGYLASLPYPVGSNCVPGLFYLVTNLGPGFSAGGQRLMSNVVPPSNVRTIGDALTERNVSWRYYGGGFNAAAAGQPNGYCDNCNPFQYATSIMTNPALRGEHLKDTADLFADLRDGTLSAVSFVKPDGLVEGHPGNSKLSLFEAFLKNILATLDGNPALKAETAVFVVFDEGGGYYDSGFIQSLDFFGDGPRIPFIVVSPYSTGGRVVHAYTDHVSILKFIERNWSVPALSARSRDNLPNPIPQAGNPYVPLNMPALGDLFDMFDFSLGSTAGDFGGDGATDLAIYRPATGEWFVFESATGFSTSTFGSPASSGVGDVAVPADFDGDGRTDLAIYRRSTGQWFILGTASGFRTAVFGAPAASGLGDTPVPRDYDGDGKADLAIFRPATGEWFIAGTATGMQVRVFGAPAASGLGDLPIPADFDGDGKADLAIYRQATGEWFIFGSASGFRTLDFGAPAVSGLGDTPVPRDYDGDGKADLAIFRTATAEWFVAGSASGVQTRVFGAPSASGLGDRPVPNDFDGDGKADLAIYRQATGQWFVLGSRVGLQTYAFGAPSAFGLGDTPLP